MNPFGRLPRVPPSSCLERGEGLWLPAPEATARLPAAVQEMELQFPLLATRAAASPVRDDLLD